MYIYVYMYICVCVLNKVIKDFQNYGVDWEEAPGEIVPETISGLNEPQIDTIRRQIPENVMINNVMDVFVNILNRTLSYITIPDS